MITRRLRIGIYLRMSLDELHDGLGIDRQRTACDTIAARHDGDVTIYADTMSASTTRGPKSDYARLLTDARAGRLDIVIVIDIDRLTRIPREIEDWIDLAPTSTRRGVRVITADGEVDTATENGRMFLRIKAAVARHEVERKGARQRLANAQRAGAGLPHAGGRRSLGYAQDGMTVIPHEADAVRLAYRLVAAGGSVRSVARAWTAAGLTTSHGGPWRPVTVLGILTNPRYAGIRAVQTNPKDPRERVIIGPAAWPGLVDEDLWRHVQAVLADPARRTPPGPVRRYLLSGTATCGRDRCGSTVHTGRTKAGTRTYMCSATRHLSRVAEPIDSWVTDVTLARLARPDLAELLAPAPADLSGLREEARDLRNRRLALADDLGMDEMILKRRDKALKARLLEVQGQLDAAAGSDLLAEFVGAADVGAVWESRSLDLRRAIVRRLLAVVILPVGTGNRVFTRGSVVVTPAPPSPGGGPAGEVDE